jgi:hypothetical protein
MRWEKLYKLVEDMRLLLDDLAEVYVQTEKRRGHSGLGQKLIYYFVWCEHEGEVYTVVSEKRQAKPETRCFHPT